MSEKLTHTDIEEIMSLIEGSSFDQLSLEMGGLKLSLRRSPAQVAAPPSAPIAAPASPAALVPPSAQAAASDPTPAPMTGLTDVPSSLLGTFYQAGKPGADPFVSIGSKVAPDTVIGIIEVMKLMTSVQAGVSGTVAEIVAPDGELVEHGQVLIRVQLD
jgi:acetyl-CoA carboxylase biotin carboxyl carrier protein